MPVLSDKRPFPVGIPGLPEGANSGVYSEILHDTNVKSFQSLEAEPIIWAGPAVGLSPRFRPNMGGSDGLKSHGGKSEGYTLYLQTARVAPNKVIQQRRMYGDSANKFNGSAGNVAIPSVFVPSSAASLWGSRGTY